MPTWPPSRSATSTQFPFAWLNELLVQNETVAGLIVPWARRRSFMLTPRARWAYWVVGRILTTPKAGEHPRGRDSPRRVPPVTLGDLTDQVSGGGCVEGGF